MRFWLKSGILVAVVGMVLGVVALPASAQTTNMNTASAQTTNMTSFRVQTPTPTVPVTPIGTNFRQQTSLPSFPVTTFAPFNSGLLLAPLYRLGINPFNNYGNWPLNYSPNTGYVYPGYSPFGYPGYGSPGYGSPGSVNINLTPSSLGGGGYPSYPPMYPIMYPSGNPYLGAASYPQASLITNPSGASTFTTGAYPNANVSPFSPNPYIPDYSPAGGYLQGVADGIAASANAQYTYQRARLLNPAGGKRLIDARYERGTQLDSEQQRQLNLRPTLDRARHDPSLNEIWSGQSLNDLYNHVKNEQGKGLKGEAISLTEDLLKHINLTIGKNGSAGLLKNDIAWPKPLQRPEFDEPRKNLDITIPEAVRQAKFGPVNANVANDVLNDVRKMHDILPKNIGDIRPGEYMEAKAYLNMLNQAARALQDREVTNYFSGEWAAKGKTVSELVKNMSEKGLQFAPAAPGDEGPYRALYNALAAYDASMTRLASTTTTK
jgi:hypothetical protein